MAALSAWRWIRLYRTRRAALPTHSMLQELSMLALLKILFSPRDEIGVRARVNRIHTITGPERIDGLVLNVRRGIAYVSWPNGDTTRESVRHLVAIIA